MIFDKETFNGQVATLTNTDSHEIEEYRLAAQNEILDLAQSEGADPSEVEFFGASASSNAQRALFWLTVLFARKDVMTIDEMYDCTLSADTAMWRMHYEDYVGHFVNDVRISSMNRFTDFSCLP